jgi:3-hydroxyisobutyrate dehydrogenase
MGEPMAVNLAKAGVPLLVWNRTPGRDAQLRSAGASVAENLDQIFDECVVVFAMLADEAALDAVLARDGRRFGRRVEGRTFVHMGTTSPEHSAELETCLRAAGGRYVEAPVSGSRGPAERGQLVAMVAGEPTAVESVQPLLPLLCRESFNCGAVPNGLLTKLAVNSFLITMVVGLVEAVRLAGAAGLDLSTLAAVLDAGPMASSVSTMKLDKLLRSDFDAQAAAADVFKNSALIAAAASTAGTAAPLLETSRDLFAETVAMGHGADDMIAVVHALAARDGHIKGDS